MPYRPENALHTQRIIKKVPQNIKGNFFRKSLLIIYHPHMQKNTSRYRSGYIPDKVTAFWVVARITKQRQKVRKVYFIAQNIIGLTLISEAVQNDTKRIEKKRKKGVKIGAHWSRGCFYMRVIFSASSII
jgi:hypothetical protein